MKLLIFLVLIICSSRCTENQKCLNKIFEGLRRHVCDNYCRYVEEEGRQNVTCSDLHQMHATLDSCSYKCTIRFTGTIDILRTNSFSLMKKLEQLFLNASSINTIQARSFAGLPSIKLINLSKNHLTVIPDNCFSYLQSLTFVDLSHNQINQIEIHSFKDCSSLTYIDLSNNNLSIISAEIFESILELKTINLSNNFLEKIDQKWCFHFHALTVIFLDNNKIESLVNCSTNVNIELFSMSNNRLKTLNGSVFPNNLKHLNLSNNDISTIINKPFERLTELKWLDLSSNKLNVLPFELFVNLGRLTNLDISKNEHMTIDEGVLHGLTNLTFLNLSNIGSTALETRIFYSTKRITHLDISQNDIFFLDIKSLLNFCPKLRFLSINGNIFPCQDLADILILSESKSIFIPSGKSYDRINLNGIECRNVADYNSNRSNQIIDYFEKGFKQSTFFKFFSSFKQPSGGDIQKLVEMEELLVKNLSKEISSSEKKILSEVLVELKSRNKIDDDLLKKFTNIVDSATTSSDKNFTSDLYAIFENQNRASLKNDDPNLKNLIPILNDLKFLLVICTLLLISFGAVRVFDRFRKKIPMRNFFLESQELPIIDRQNTQIQ